MATESLELSLDDVMQLEFCLADRHRRISEDIAALKKEEAENQNHESINFIRRQVEYTTNIYKGQQEDIELQLYYLRGMYLNHPRDLKHLFKP